ncbi:molybdopterin-dependent oxidoreductase [Megalodesulfovibrio gigas]|uniref:Putative trimethylamine-N-oxide reductase (Cytochrome c) n=1 Tax=Megalodesulfovibrio gigas (strain ATCC 19364 / DSM 1382 / NCIMB 9332 / VKM B-1759) TaxID=1121448 RepID=T2GAC5_MEGG1|nr:molybdopterin-dependent oxidoreductase [Megalodesulfovibrio gigas]AGW13119.1 putative trimethylamine-N-oxide reductase (cytochrome c) [Megalodesulfovibrio gigas DSM 1382 = ATCC 19364]
MSVRTVVTTCTRDCPNTCGLLATVEGDRLTRLAGDPAHPFIKGKVCRKAMRYIERVYSPERITRPMLRRGDQWEIVSWDTALDLIAGRMHRIRDESGPEAILYYQGFGERTALKLLNKYFFNLFGGVTTMHGTLCGGTGQASQNLDYGERVSHDPLDHLHSASMVLWARNPVTTNISLAPIARDVARRGGRVLLVDPAPTKSASLASRHIAPRPGGDAFLALAAARLILDAGAEDRAFLEQHAEGLDGYLRLVHRWDVAELCRLAGVPVADAEHLAETLMTQKPTSILLGWGLHRHVQAHLTIRAIDALGAVSGNIGVAGGGVSQGFEEYGPYDQHYWGDSLRPPRRTLLMPRVGEEILAATDPPIRMIYVTAANPVCTAPRSDKVAQAFRQAEFVVYSGHFLDDTAALAHVFLPATTFLEEEDVVASYGHNYVGPITPAIAPVGQCKSEFRMFYELAARFDFADQFRKPEAEWLERICAPIRQQGCSLEQLRQGAFRLDAPMVPFADRTFPTPSGRFRLVGDLAEMEAMADALGAADPARPFRLLTIAPHRFICSERTMAEHEPLPEVQCNAAVAASLGLEDGDAVRLHSAEGQAAARLRTREDLRPDILVAERGGWTRAGHDLNRLIKDVASRVGNGTPYYEATVGLEPLPSSCSGSPQASPCRPPQVLVIQHGLHSLGGNFLKHLEQQGCRLHTVRAFEGEALPHTPQDYAALVVMGGPQHAWDDEAWPHIPPLLRLMREFDALGRPVAGVCLGAQLLARAWGGECFAMEALEFGFVQHAVTEAGQVDPVLGPALPLPRLMEFHQDSFRLPPEATLLVRGEACEAQCFRVGRVSYGFQFHLEVDAATVAHWTRLLREGAVETYRQYREQHDEACFETLAAELPVLADRGERFCREIVARWLAQTQTQTQVQAH